MDVPKAGEESAEPGAGHEVRLRRWGQMEIWRVKALSVHGGLRGQMDVPKAGEESAGQERAMR